MVLYILVLIFLVLVILEVRTMIKERKDRRG